VNNDVKIILPNKISIYYDCRNNISEFRINQNKIIYNFHNLKQIEMKYTNSRGVKIDEVYKNEELVRNENGNVRRFKKVGNKFIEY